MDKRKLKQEELQEVYAFCKRKEIQYLELRMELVDHIASRIESHWEEDPNLTFKDAFHKVYKSFGIFGLSEVAEAHEKTVAKRFYQKAWLEFKSWLKPPKVMAFALVLMLFLSLVYYYPPSSLALVQLNYLVAIVGLIFMFWKKRSLAKSLDGDQSMLMGSVYQGGIIFYVVFMGPGFNVLKFDASDYLHSTAIIHQAFALSLTLINVLLLVVVGRLLQTAESQLDELRQRIAVYSC